MKYYDLIKTILQKRINNMKRITKLFFLGLFINLSIGVFAQPPQTCGTNTYFTSNAGWSQSEYYQIIDIDAATLTDAALPKFSTANGALNAADTDFGSGIFTTPIMSTVDGTSYTPTSVLWPIKYSLAAFAPTMYTSAWSKVNITGQTPSGNSTDKACTLNDNSIIQSAIYDKPGFIELCRLAASAEEPTVSRHGYIEIDNLPSVERIQWSYSSTSWKRGVKADINYNDGAGWIPLRWEASDISIWIATFAEQGYQFEEIIGQGDNPDSRVSIRFGIWDGDSIHVNPVKTDGSTFTTANFPLEQRQTVRIHQIKVFSGVIPTEAPSAVASVNANNLKIYLSENNIILSENAKVEMYSIVGKRVFSGVTNKIDVSNFNKGIYIIKAVDSEGKIQNKKIAI